MGGVIDRVPQRAISAIAVITFANVLVRYFTDSEVLGLRFASSQFEGGVNTVLFCDRDKCVNPPGADMNQEGWPAPEVFDEVVTKFPARLPWLQLDPDTVVSPGSWEAALRATGATMGLLLSSMVSYLDSSPRRPADTERKLRALLMSPLPAGVGADECVMRAQLSVGGRWRAQDAHQPG